VLYGAILTVLGIGASDAEIEKAAGINLNLWVGIGMLAIGALFLLWAFTRPLSEQLEEDEEERDAAVPGAPAPVGADAAAFAGSETTRRRPRRDRAGAAGDGRFRR
jgi:membrane protein implicated in regulation of membrane protease activity